MHKKHKLHKKGPNPFVGLTLEDVERAEEASYMIQIGPDFFCYDGRFTFSKKDTATFYNKILNDLKHMLNNGSSRERRDAKKYLSSFHIFPLRIH